jgi:Uma2 family endonuclease
MTTRRSVSIEDRVRLPESAFELEGYRAWVKSDECPEWVRTTYVSGEVLIEMSPEALERHNKVKTAVTIGIGTFVEQHDLGEVYSDRTLLSHEQAGLSVEPDLTFVSWGSFEAGRVGRVAQAAAADYVELVGGADLVVEIVSDGSVRKDTVLLRDAYARAGVREYWLIDARGHEIEFEILVNENGTLRPPARRDTPQDSRVLDGCWTLARRTNRAGHFAYRLTHSPR